MGLELHIHRLPAYMAFASLGYLALKIVTCVVF